MVGKIKLYTSLPPAAGRQLAGAEVGQAYLDQCVTSWRRADFEVISLNSAEEIASLSQRGYDVELRQISGNRPTLTDFLGTIRDSGSQVAAIINADVFLSNHPELLNAVAGRSAEGMIILERINIDAISLRPTGQTCNGFDAFIFRTEPLGRIDLDFDCLFGQPWWDYWLPLAYAGGGGKLMKIKDPFLFHLDHPQKWNQGQWIANGQKTVKYFLRSTGALPDEFVAEIAKFAESSDLSEGKLGPFGHWCFAKLRAMAELIQPSRRPDDGGLLPALVGFLDNPNSRGLIGELNEANARIAAMAETHARLAAMNEAHVRILTMNENLDAGQKSEAIEQFKQISDLLRQTSSVVLGKPISNYEDVLETITAANYVLGSRKATLNRFVALNVAWIRRKCSGLYDREL